MNELAEREKAFECGVWHKLGLTATVRFEKMVKIFRSVPERLLLPGCIVLSKGHIKVIYDDFRSLYKNI